MRAGSKAKWPAVDERLVMPGTRYEIVDGELIYVAPAKEPHGRQHSKVTALLEAHVREGYDVACDMLTRASETNDFAPDGSVYPSAPDPTTGGRQLEELAFELVSARSLSLVRKKARALTTRGVRRVFAIDLGRQRALEWSVATGTWSLLDSHTSIDDPALAALLPVADLVYAARTDDAVARALLAKQNPVLTQALARRSAEAVLEVLRGRGLRVTARQAARILETSDEATLRAWLHAAGTCPSTAALLKR